MISEHIPNKFKLGLTEFTVNMHDRIEAPNCNIQYGCAYCFAGIIDIAKGYKFKDADRPESDSVIEGVFNNDVIDNTFYHELVHMIFHTASLTTTTNPKYRPSPTSYTNT